MSTTTPSTFPASSPYRSLARALDALPNGFPPAPDESDLLLLAKLYSEEEASLAAQLMPEAETPIQIGERLGRDPRELAPILKDMVRKGLISFGKTEQGRPGFSLMPFVVGIYEMQNGRIDEEFARLFERYYQTAFKQILAIAPQLHRVIPVGETVKNNMEVHPYESVDALLDRFQSWGVVDCICRTQKTLIGEPCGHPLDVCMTLSDRPNAFSGDTDVRVLTRDEAHQVLRRAAEAGLVHTVSNNQRDMWYLCNCCTCGCTILRGMAEMGIANVVARSAFINQVDVERCSACENCVSACSFHAIEVDQTAMINETRCIGCGVCVPVCPSGALSLVRREGEKEPPASEADWRAERSQARSALIP
ncbi:MAG TPA: 4Fe-4S dicluster domain-containing protein [Anaerolineaceae bacterium]|nr:4Fe-4S dicluster domain-containing protein [Anaerolineaceae bacterium]